MTAYFEQLLSSQLPFSIAGLMALWAALYAVSWLVSRRSRQLAGSQTVVRLADQPVPQSVGATLRHVVLSLLLIAIGPVVGGLAFVFVTGGWLVVTAAILGLNLHSMLFSRALTQPGAAQGSVVLAKATAMRTQVGQITGAAATCTGLALFIPHLALLGGAVFLWLAALVFATRTKLAAKEAA